MKKLLLIPLLLIAFGSGWLLKPTKIETKTVTITEDCPNWICTTRSDSRQIDQYVAECNPQEARKIGTEIYGYWCTSDVNPVDKFNLKPNDWEWTE